MTVGERSFKLAFTFVLAMLFFLFGGNLLVSILVAHGVNFLTNGQLPVLMRYVMTDIGVTKRKVKSAVEKISSTAPQWDVEDVLIFGSFSRFQMQSSSDLDLRL